MEEKWMFFGDSNTFGFDPAGFWGGRYDKNKIWTGLLQKAHPEVKVINCGQNGREIPHSKLQYDFLEGDLMRHGPLDLFAVMLGSNDLFCMVHPTAGAIAARMEEMLWFVKEHPAVTEDTKILLIAPAQIRLGIGFGREIEEAALGLGEQMREVAGRHSVDFADAWEWDIPLAADGVHFTLEGHRRFYQRLEQFLTGAEEG